MTKATTRNIIALIVVVSIIGGFFAGLVSSEFFYATIGMIVSHFYQEGKITDLKETVQEQTITIKSLSDNG